MKAIKSVFCTPALILVGLLATAPCHSAGAPSGAVAPADIDGETLYKNYACASCHGERGLNPLPGMPKLGGQDKTYLLYQFRDFKSGARTNGRSQTMIGYFQTITNAEMTAMADWLSVQ